MTRLLEKMRENKKAWLIIAFSLFLAANTILYLDQKIPGAHFFGLALNANIFYFFHFAFSAMAAGSLFLFNEKVDFKELLKNILVLYLPLEIALICGLQQQAKLNYLVGIASAAYLLLAIIYLFLRSTAPATRWGFSFAELPKKLKERVLKQDWMAVILVLAVMVTSFGFGVYRLGKLAAVDEPLWTFNRIPNFWKDLGVYNWHGARVSDKPGLTVALISGVGLLFENNPKQFKHIDWYDEVSGANTLNVEKFNIIFRLPLFVFVVLTLPLFYWLIKKLSGKSAALFSVIFIGLSPILIGNSRIINPDGLLWVFSSLSLLSYLAYLKKQENKYLHLGAIFLGLSILTKYTANILYVFFFALIFAEYIFNRKKYSEIPAGQYLKKSLRDYGILVFISLALCYALYPAVWGKPSRLFILTAGSQAFESVWPLFAGIVSLVVADLLIAKSLILSFILRIFTKIRKPLAVLVFGSFILSVAAVFFNVYSQMKFFDFEGILSSPKSSYAIEGPTGIFFANFYPLIFGISPLAFFAVMAYLIKSLADRRFEEKNVLVILYLVAFILMYYAGSVFSHVASIIRYQIMLFPVILIAAGISLAEILRHLANGNQRFVSASRPASCFFLFLLLSVTLYQTKPFYMGYASSLLPEKYYLDVKDMGEGSYEAAFHLNSLPDAKKITIWTDKRGVCVFFKGKCHTTLDFDFLSNAKIDYFVVSSGRANRTSKMTAYLPLKEAYNSSDFEYKLEINGRPNNFVKIIKAPNGME